MFMGPAPSCTDHGVEQQNPEIPSYTLDQFAYFVDYTILHEQQPKADIGLL